MRVRVLVHVCARVRVRVRVPSPAPVLALAHITHAYILCALQHSACRWVPTRFACLLQPGSVRALMPEMYPHWQASMSGVGRLTSLPDSTKDTPTLPFHPSLHHTCSLICVLNSGKFASKRVTGMPAL